MTSVNVLVATNKWATDAVDVSYDLSLKSINQVNYNVQQHYFGCNQLLFCSNALAQNV